MSHTPSLSLDGQTQTVLDLGDIEHLLSPHFSSLSMSHLLAAIIHRLNEIQTSADGRLLAEENEKLTACAAMALHLSKRMRGDQ